MYAYIGSNLVNLDKIKSLIESGNSVWITFDDDKVENFATKTPVEDLQRIFYQQKNKK